MAMHGWAVGQRAMGFCCGSTCLGLHLRPFDQTAIRSRNAYLDVRRGNKTEAKVDKSSEHTIARCALTQPLQCHPCR
jgi:hypothetical protein